MTMQSPFIILWSLLMLLSAGGIGRMLRGLRRPKEASRFEEIVVYTSLGFGVMSLAIFALLALRLMGHGREAVLVLLALPGVKVAFDIAPRIRRLRTWRPGIGSVLVGVLLVILALAALIPALAPPSMDDWDTLAYHFAVPKLYLQYGGFYYIPFTSHSNFPFLMEMLYIPGLMLDSPSAAKMMHYWMGILLVAAVYVLTKRHFNAKAAPLAAIAVAGMPIVLWEATTGYVDLATALYTVLCVHLLLNYFDTNDRRYLVGCAISAGFAASTKMTGLALIPLLAIWLVADRYASERRFEWKRALMLVGVALLVCSPWYIKSLVYTGNPVYPFFYSIFGGRDWTAALAQNYSMLQAKFGMGHNAGAFLLLPYNLTFFSSAFYDTPGLYVGPIFLVSLPLLFLMRSASRKMIGMLGFFLALMVVWFGLSQQSRYLIPAFAVLAVLVAGLVHQDERLRLTRRVLMGVFVATALFGAWTLRPMIGRAIPTVFGSESKSDYLTRTLDVYPAEEWINEHLPKPSKIALYGDTRGFYLDRDYVWADPGHNVEFTRDFASAEEMVSYLRSKGVTHALVNFRFNFVPPAKATGVQKLIYEAIDKGLFKEVYSPGTGAVAVYEVQ